MNGSLPLITICLFSLWSWNYGAVAIQPTGTDSDELVPLNGRYKRTMPTVLGKLLARAKLLMNNGDYRLYSRPGGYAKARADFEALGLTNIKQTQLGFEGRVEDQTVLLRYVGTMGGDGVIDIMKATKSSDGELVPSTIDRIRYSIVRDRPPEKKRLRINSRYL